MATKKTEITRRDYFAARALPLAIEHWKNCDADEPGGGKFNWCTEFDPGDDCMAAAELAYRMADAMLAARDLND